MATATIPANSESSQVTPSSGGKRLVKSKSGLKIVCQHDRESAPWDMAEPQWTPDKEVCHKMIDMQYFCSNMTFYQIYIIDDL
jgi:hypothetical protein